jgi:hypothetical protein
MGENTVPRYVLGSSHDAILPEGAVYPACRIRQGADFFVEDPTTGHSAVYGFTAEWLCDLRSPRDTAEQH